MRVTAGPYNLVDGAVPEADGAPVEPWSPEAAGARLRRVAPQVPVPIPPDAALLPGASNDAWLLGDTVLRVCWRGDRTRLLREARLLAALPASIPHPRVRASGGDGAVSWVLADRVVGPTLADVWADAVPDQRQRLVAQLMRALRDLHDWTPPSAIARLVDDPPDVPNDGLTIVGRSVVPLPVARLRRVIACARALPFVVGAVLDAADDRARDLADAWPTDDAPRVLTHGDASPGNVVVRDGAIAALLDYEWARLGPRDLELLPLLVWSERLGPAPRRPPLLAWAREAYPELFAAPDLDRRLWLYQLAYTVRGIVVWPPDREEATLDPRHPMRRLRILVDRPAYHLA